MMVVMIVYSFFRSQNMLPIRAYVTVQLELVLQLVLICGTCNIVMIASGVGGGGDDDARPEVPWKLVF